MSLSVAGGGDVVDSGMKSSETVVVDVGVVADVLCVIRFLLKILDAWSKTKVSTVSALTFP